MHLYIEKLFVKEVEEYGISNWYYKNNNTLNKWITLITLIGYVLIRSITRLYNKDTKKENSLADSVIKAAKPADKSSLILKEELKYLL